MANLKYHFKSITYSGYDAFREPLELRFALESDRKIKDFSVRFIDGFTKSLICQAIAAICDHLEFSLSLFETFWKVLNGGSRSTLLDAV